MRSWLPGYGVTARFRPSSLFTVQRSACSSSGPAASANRPVRVSLVPGLVSENHTAHHVHGSFFCVSRWSVLPYANC
jgi:hypothetical protein